MHKKDRQYFEQDIVWDSSLGPGEWQCVRLLNGIIGPGVKSLIDIGAGSGRLLNNLAYQGQTVAIDASETAVRQARGARIVGSVTDIPFADNAFEVSLCSNVLEHLDDADLEKAIHEIDRVTRKTAIIVSPIDEDLAGQAIICANCGCHFHPNGHKRRFAVDDFSKLLKRFHTTLVAPFGDPWLAAPVGAAFERTLGNDIHRFAGAMCPNCAHVVAPDSTQQVLYPPLMDALAPFEPEFTRRGAVPSSAVIVLSRTNKRQTFDPPGPLWIEQRGKPVSQHTVIRRPAGAVDLARELDYLPANLDAPTVIVPPGSLWQNAAGSGEGRTIATKGDPDGQALIAIPADIARAGTHIIIRFRDHASIGFDVALHDSVLGYRSLGKVGGTGSGDVREQSLPMPAFVRPDRSVVLLRLSPAGAAKARIDILSLRIALAADEPASETRKTGHLPAKALLKRLGQEQLAVGTGHTEARLMADGSAFGFGPYPVLLGQGAHIAVPRWLATHTKNGTVRAKDAEARLRTALRLALETLAFLDRHAAGDLQAKASAFASDLEALIEMMAPGLDRTGANALMTQLLGADALPAMATAAALPDTDTAELSILRDALTEAEARLAALATEHQNVVNLANDVEARRSRTESLLRERDTTIASLEDSLTRLQSDVQRHASDYQTAERRHAGLAARFAALEQDSEQRSGELLRAQDALAAARREGSLLQARIATAEQEALSRVMEYEEAQKALLATRREATNLKLKLTAAEQESADLLAHLEETSGRVAKMRAQVRVAIDERDDARFETDRKAQEVQTLQRLANDIEARRANTEKLLQERDATIAAANELLLQRQAALEQASAAHAAALAGREAVEAELARLRAERNSFDIAQTAIAADLDALTKKHDALQAKNDAVEIEAERRRNELEVLQAQSDAMRQEHERTLAQLNAEHEALIRQQQAETQQLSKDYEAAQARLTESIAAERAEIEQLRQLVARHEQAARTEKDEIRKLEKVLAERTRSLQDAQRKLAEHDASLAKIRQAGTAEAAAARAEVEALGRERRLLEEQIADLSSRLTDQQSVAEQARGLLQTRETELGDLRRKITALDGDIARAIEAARTRDDIIKELVRQKNSAAPRTGFPGRDH